MLFLASVVEAAEVDAAVSGGADIIDIKNPAEGSLGAACPGLIRQVRDRAPAHVPVSAAIGDIPALPGTVALAALGAASCGVQYVKVGLRGTKDANQAEAVMRAVREAVKASRPEVMIIATGYADAADFGAVTPNALPEAAARAGADGCMLDTIAKGGGNSLFSFMTSKELGEFLTRCRDLNMLSALAGSLAEADAGRIVALGPDIAGFRSAICGGDRSYGRVDAGSVQRLKRALRTGGGAAAA
jgi:hypothetical protein